MFCHINVLQAAVIRLSAVDKVYILPPVAYETNFDRLNCYKVLKSLHDTKISDVSITCNASTSPSKVRTTDCTVSLPSDRPPSPPPPPNDRALGDENVRVITATSNKQGAGTDSIPSSFLSSLFEEVSIDAMYSCTKGGIQSQKYTAICFGPCGYSIRERMSCMYM